MSSSLVRRIFRPAISEAKMRELIGVVQGGDWSRTKDGGVILEHQGYRFVLETILPAEQTEVQILLAERPVLVAFVMPREIPATNGKQTHAAENLSESIIHEIYVTEGKQTRAAEDLIKSIFSSVSTFCSVSTKRAV